MRPEVVAHRGASAHRAEHTLGAYELAIEQGADAFECDVRVSRDGQLVCVHDRRIDRTSNGRGVVSELTVSRMAHLDFSGWHHQTHERGVLTLDALLGLAKDSSVRLFVETKHPVRYAGLVEAKLVALLARHGLNAPEDKQNSPVVMMSFSSAAVRRVREAAPRVPTVLLFDRLPKRLGSGMLPPWADHAGPDVRLLRRHSDYVARAAEHGHDTYCWTVDDPADVELCARAGVRYVATNRPADTRSRLDQG
ncbi:glycerophosphodiester phosphodiesterase [Saccharopolyspora taberi]|uniref:Glycerophosphodiester phosphodiesterase n=1 Tax=Saccharopolyspora taberi TaxID=60895 RepID=A0ABN3VMC2_9PSEU